MSLPSSTRTGRRPWHSAALLIATLGLAGTVGNACSAIGEDNGNSSGSDDDDDASGTLSGGGGAGGLNLTSGSGGGGPVGDPVTCEEAEAASSYIGCDFYPTVTPNAVWSIFDFAVAIANAGDNVVEVTVERGGQVVATQQIQPDSLGTVYLPWVPALKGPDSDMFGVPSPLTASARVSDGAYRVTTSHPVTVYQFNALEYAPQGGPPGKSWVGCPGDLTVGCFSYSNDASLLLPATAMTGNYRVAASAGWPAASMGPFLTVTGTQDGTNVDMFLSATGQIQPGGGLPAVGPNGSTNFTLNRGEVMLLVGSADSDFSGSRIAASAPVQLIVGMPCVNVPLASAACDHIEESVFPAETLGKHYFVARPTGPNGDAPGHMVRIYGNFDNTALSYPAGMPNGAPTTISAGQVVDLGIVTTDFEVEGDQSFAIASFQQGGSVVDPGGMLGVQKGDPAMSLATAAEQYRKKYVFLAPTDYDVNFVDIVQPMTATVLLDGQPTGVPPQAIGSGYGVARVMLNNSGDGSHVLESDQPVGVQVSGYGAYTSYYYPGGLDLNAIAPPPIN